MFTILVIVSLHFIIVISLDSSCQTARDDAHLDRVIDHECRLRRLEDILEKFVKIHYTWTQEAETCEPKCPDGWVAFQESCYLFWNKTSISFANASEICKQNGAHVVFVETAEENSFLKNYLRKMKAAFWWIGLTDEKTEGTWKWYGTDNVAQLTDWNPGEPNGGRTDNCCHFWSWHDYTWNDIGCNAEKVYTLYAICEKRRSLTLG